MSTLDEIVAREFPRVREGVIYLNSASTGPLPERARRVAQAEADRRSVPWTYGAAEQFGTLDRSRELVARMIGASTAEIALMMNTSAGINLAARSLPFARGDVIVTSDRDFPANVYPWMALARDVGVEIRRLPCRDRWFDEEGLLAAIEAPGVKALVVSWVSFESGMRLDLDRLGAACRARGVYFVVDAIQGLGPLTLDLRRTPVDILACGTQKWLLSPWGSGFVYVREGLVRELEPRQVSWMSMEGTDDFTRLLDYRFQYWPDARRFEMVTLPYQDFATMNASLEVLEEIGHAAVAARVASLADHLVRRAEEIGLMVVTPTDPARRAGIVAVRPSDPAAIAERLTAAGVVFSLREGAIRLSPHVFTPVEHIDRAMDLMRAGHSAG